MIVRRKLWVMTTPDITVRYSVAAAAFGDAMTAPGMTVPLTKERTAAAHEYVEAASAYADDLESNGHAVPAGLRDDISRAERLLVSLFGLAAPLRGESWS